jgi:hypothetical protein
LCHAGIGDPSWRPLLFLGGCESECLSRKLLRKLPAFFVLALTWPQAFSNRCFTNQLLFCLFSGVHTRVFREASFLGLRKSVTLCLPSVKATEMPYCLTSIPPNRFSLLQRFNLIVLFLVQEAAPT